MVLLFLASVGRCYYEAKCEATSSIVYCSSAAYGVSCSSVGNCCKRTSISVTSSGYTYTSSNSVCNPCYVPAGTTTFQKSVQSTYGGTCACGQVETIPSYYLNGHLIPGVTFIACMNQCCGDGGSGPDSSGSSLDSKKIAIIVGSVIGSIILLIVIGLACKYNEDPHFFDPVMAWFQPNQPVYHHGRVSNSHQPSINAMAGLDQVPQNEIPSDAPCPQPPSASYAQAVVNYNLQPVVSDQQAVIRVREYSSPIKNEEHDATKAQLFGSPAEVPSKSAKRLFQSSERERPEVIMERPQAEEHLSASLDDRIHEENNYPQ